MFSTEKSITASPAPIAANLMTVVSDEEPPLCIDIRFIFPSEAPPSLLTYERSEGSYVNTPSATEI